MKGVLRLGAPALVKTRGSPPSLRMTSKIKGRSKSKSQRQPQGEELIQGFGGIEDLFGTGADPVVLCEIDPAHGSVGSDEEFSGTGDVAAVDALSGVNEVVTA